MAQRVRRRQDDHRAARPPDSPLRHRGNRQRQLALQKPRRRSRNPRSPRLRNPGQLRRGERYRQNPPLKGVKIGRRCGVKFERRLTDRGSLRRDALASAGTDPTEIEANTFAAELLMPTDLLMAALSERSYGLIIF